VIHAHVERTISHEAEPALRIFELPGRDTDIEKRAADRPNAKLIENAGCAPEIRLSQGKAFAERANCSLTCWMASGSRSSARTLAPLSKNASV